ncbi:sulfite reductase subunit alpha [Thauera linaloolentis]|uniref:NADPH--hemoprotein reductase n=1 Tax=Thauera linaloolentis (strain DSM 12138 / JCM 21573 / CCUG 41526 / CIP 105981 / IAM 15112 / NBRC 102519 / 47Lol) TaxID=1123367 RepID=N6Z2M4_THAL4|nr:sulfite reductase subunit alpha [Thauera linaloolentis]ENO88628.1 oxidoreductase binding flavins [Thauera linaloolentis 47Lol = DSM 12138]MCM8565673.1 sulfite reductase subunit alpha [Thauera linaloolentis]
MISLELSRVGPAAGVVAAYAAFCLRIWAAHRKRAAAHSATGADAVLVAYASQSGFGRELSEEAAKALESTGIGVRLCPLDALDADGLKACRQALFVVSTCGEGDAPDNAAGFVRRVMEHAPSLHGLHYGVLALGDSSYTHYCGFGRRLDAWLGACGATPMFPRIDMDRADGSALATWRHRLAAFAGLAELPESDLPTLGFWRVRSHRHLNPGSAGEPAWHVELEALDGDGPDARSVPLPDWQAGDLLQLYPPGDASSPRDYSIASLPGDDTVQLLVRRARGQDGSPGVMSSLLTSPAGLGAVLHGRIRPHPNFRIGDNADRPLLLIGNGTGLAGLLAHLRQRVRYGDGRNWLVFGERNKAHDDFHGAEIEALEEQDLLARCDRVYSRDDPAEYVQDRLARAADTVRDWVAGDAAIYVCGNAVGMGPAVHETLAAILGSDTLERLAQEGRYRRDIY